MNAKNSERIDVDILISGYGPTGATLASLLGQRGHSVLIMDQAASIYDKPRAITADQEVFRVLQECGMASEVAEMASPHPGTDYVGLEGQIIKRFYPAPPPNALGWEPSWMFVQPELEAVMRKAIDKIPHVRTSLAHQLIDFEQDHDGVTARILNLQESKEIKVRARYLLAADGASSLVRKQLAAPIEDLAFDEWWVVVDAWIHGPIELPRRCVQYCRPSRPTSLAPEICAAGKSSYCRTKIPSFIATIMKRYGACWANSPTHSTWRIAGPPCIDSMPWSCKSGAKAGSFWPVMRRTKCLLF
jgi:3-(3-hydroxy-phenyl)propionate hydroxylase